jgi:polygalacturonase
VLGGGEVLVPAGEYMTGAIVLRSNTLLRLDESAALLGTPDLTDYPITQVRWEGHWIKGYIGFISAMDAENIGLVGPGKIVGNNLIKGRVDRQTELRHPAPIEFTNRKNVHMENCVTSQNDMWSIHPTYCENLTFKNVTVNGARTVLISIPASMSLSTAATLPQPMIAFRSSPAAVRKAMPSIA